MKEAEGAGGAPGHCFSAGADAEVPTLTLHAEDYRDGSIGLPALQFGQAGFAKSTSKHITQGGVTLDGEKITDVKAVLRPRIWRRASCSARVKRTISRS